MIETIIDTFNDYSQVSIIASSTPASLWCKGQVTFQDGAMNYVQSFASKWGWSWAVNDRDLWIIVSFTYLFTHSRCTAISSRMGRKNKIYNKSISWQAQEQTEAQGYWRYVGTKPELHIHQRRGEEGGDEGGRWFMDSILSWYIPLERISDDCEKFTVRTCRDRDGAVS
jgi:hypothetical protein